MLHNYYQQPGGEDLVFESEAELLEEAGHYVIRFTRHNESISRSSALSVSTGAIWSQETFKELCRLIALRKPHVMHLHNTLPLISPSAYYAARRYGVPTVQTLHNYRLNCPSSDFFREGAQCEDCLGKFFPWPGILHACYRHSRSSSAVVASMLSAHRITRNWQKIDRYVALSQFSKRKFVEGGLRPESISVKPNFVYPDPGRGGNREHYALFVGRLSSEKGIQTLLEAWSRIGLRLPLKIVGDGPMASSVASAAKNLRGIEWFKHRTRPEVLSLMGKALFQVVPSVCYENFPLVCAEAFAKGTPVLGSDIGAIREILADERAGVRFKAGDIRDLISKAEWLVEHPHEVAEMGTRAREEFEAKYTAEANYKALLSIYESTISVQH